MAVQQVKSANGITLVPIDARLFAHRKVFIQGEINKASACEFEQKIMLLNYEDSDAFIDVVIDSHGGEIEVGMLMYDCIQGSAAPIRLFCTGSAYSMAAVLFSGGNHGRYLLPHAKVMLHEPLISGGIGGKSSSIKSISDSLLETRKMLNEILAFHTHKSLEEIDEATSYDHYFSAREAVAFGLADQICSLKMLLGEA